MGFGSNHINLSYIRTSRYFVVTTVVVTFMSNYFNPGSAKYRRGVWLTSVYACSLVAVQMLMTDWGSQEHVFTPVQKFINKQGDAFFDVKHDELYGPRKIKPESLDKPLFSLKRIDLNDQNNGKSDPSPGSQK